MSLPVKVVDVGGRPTRTRYGVVAILVALAMVTYLDRACIGTLAPWISKDLGLTKDQMGWVFSAFALAYAAFEIPTAAWADRRGTRRVLTRIVVWWSSFTIATAAALGLLAGLPAILSVAADLLGGLTTDWGVARLGPRWGRCGVGGVAYLLAGAGMLSAAAAPHPILAAVSIAAATAASMFTLGAAWGVCLDIGGHHAGVVSAAMNTSGQIGSVLSPLIVSFCLKHWANWDLPLYLMGGLFLLGALAWCFVSPRRAVFE